MRQITLIRHGLTDWNSSGKFQGQKDIPLSLAGEAQTRLLADHLGNVLPSPDMVFSSPLRRALETAQIVYPETDLQLDDRLKEIDFGQFEGFTQAENAQHDSWRYWLADPFKRCAPGGESYEALRNRAVNWLEALPDCRHIVAFTHSGTIRMLVSHVLGVEHPLWRKRIRLQHTGLTRFVFCEDELLLERVNDAHHLDVLVPR